MRGRRIRRTWKYDPSLYAPARYRRACAYEALIPDPISQIQVDLRGDVAGVVSDAEQAIAALNAQAGPELMPLARLLLRTESIASSKVEGMQADARTLARAEVLQHTGRSVGTEAMEILANIDAMELAIERASTSADIRVQDILDIHQVLLARDTRGIAGKTRDRQNWIGGNDYNPCGADYVPPPPEEVKRLLKDLGRFCNEEGLPPLIQSAFAHAQFEAIHPFDDGNGRAGRALVQVLLRRRGLAPAFVPPISVVLAQDKPSYIRGLTLFQQNDLSGWIEVFASAAARAAQLATKYTTRVIHLQDQWRSQLRQYSDPRADAGAWAVIDLLPGHPIVTVPVAVAASNRTKPAISKAIAELEDAGVLVPLSNSRRNRAWEAQGLLELVVGLESGAG
jgi:Fic family protein